MEYVKTGATTDSTPPPTPFNVKASVKGDDGIEITWDAEADFGGFRVLSRFAVGLQ